MSLFRLFACGKLQASGILIACCCWAAPVCASEASLRTAFIYNFIKFIEWPELANESAIRLCILDDDGEMHQASSSLRGRSVAKHTIDVAYISPNRVTLSVIQHCQMLYIGSAYNLLPHDLPQGLVVVANEAPAITPGVSISLHRNRSGRLEFTINSDAINRGGTTVSSQLLKLAANKQGGD